MAILNEPHGYLTLLAWIVSVSSIVTACLITLVRLCWRRGKPIEEP